MGEFPPGTLFLLPGAHEPARFATTLLLVWQEVFRE